MKLHHLYYAFAFALLYSCKKISDISQASSLNAVHNLAVSGLGLKFGVLIAKSATTIDSEGVPEGSIDSWPPALNSVTGPAWAHDSLGVKYYRLDVNHNEWDSAGEPGYRRSFITRYNNAVNAGLSILLNVDWWRQSETGKPYPDSADYSAFLKEVLDTLTTKPALVVVENEECNDTYDNSDSTKIRKYLNELTAGANRCKTYSPNIPVTNGGLNFRVLSYITWYWLKYTKRYKARADTFARRVLPPHIYTSLTTGGKNSVISKWRPYIVNCATTGITYANLHWYEPAFLTGWNSSMDGGKPESQRNLDTATNELSEVILYLKNVTRKTVVSNETGILWTSSFLVDNFISDLAAYDMPFTCWYDGDGSEKYFAKALHSTGASGEASFRITGSAFAQWMQGNGTTYP